MKSCISCLSFFESELSEGERRRGAVLLEAPGHFVDMYSVLRTVQWNCLSLPCLPHSHRTRDRLIRREKEVEVSAMINSSRRAWGGGGGRGAKCLWYGYNRANWINVNGRNTGMYGQESRFHSERDY